LNYGFWKNEINPTNFDTDVLETRVLRADLGGSSHAIAKGGTVRIRMPHLIPEKWDTRQLQLKIASLSVRSGGWQLIR
jgi:hypothetical protein